MTPTEPSRELLVRAFEAAVAAADPSAAIAAHLPPPPKGRTLVVGGGKAAVAMVAALERLIPAEQPLAGLVIAPHALAQRATVGRIEIAGGAHPVPDAAGVAACQRMLALLAEANADDRVLVLISGGGSSLLGLPLGLTLGAYQELFEVLLASGADITAMNALRRRFGALAGGRLAAAAFPAAVTGWIVSDVVGDALHDVASGPTSRDPSSAEEVLALLERFAPQLEGVRRALARTPPPPAADDPLWTRVENRLIVSNRASLEAARRTLEAAGWSARVVSAEVTGEARHAGAEHARWVRASLAGEGAFAPPVALISGGETTVTLGERTSDQRGRGGRNSEFALALALALPENAPVWALVADSDGVDGLGGHAGAFVTPELFGRVARCEAERALHEHDSLTLFERAQHEFVCGPTGTNVNDVRILLVAAPGRGVG